MRRNKTDVFQVRVDDHLGELLRRDADRQRLSLSAWVRAILAQHYADELEAARGGDWAGRDSIGLGELADAVTGGNERAMRKLLNDAGAGLDEYAEDRGELVARRVVVDLLALRAGDRVGRVLGGLLTGQK